MLTEEIVNKALDESFLILSNNNQSSNKTFSVNFNKEFTIKYNNKVVSIITDKLVAIETYNNIKL